jgi:hypothetical protein
MRGALFYLHQVPRSCQLQVAASGLVDEPRQLAVRDGHAG